MTGLGLKFYNMVTVYTITYNEEIMIEFFIQHYRKNFPNCEINIFDNYSTDRTVEIAKKYNCIIHYYDTNNKLSDNDYLKIKNNCWKTSETDWVIVCDCDELIEINHFDLTNETNLSTSIIKPEGYSLLSYNEEIDLGLITEGFRDKSFDKCILFNKSVLKEINFLPGSHSCSPVGYNSVRPIYNNNNTYRLLHYKYLNPKYTIQRNKMYSKRLSEVNKSNGWGYHYQWTDEKIEKLYQENKKLLIKLL